MTPEQMDGMHATTLSPQEVAALNERLTLLGVDTRIAKSLLSDMLDVLVEMAFTIPDSFWSTQGGNDVFIRAVLAEATGQSRNWDSEKYRGQPLLAFVRAVNKSVHCTERTSGARQLRNAVIYDQSGEYCALCGDHDDLEVDHITPVNAGGSTDAVRNLQLLCSACNSAKRAYKARLLPEMLSACTSDRISAAVRFKCLLQSAQPVAGRPHAQCSACGCSSSVRQILVERKSTKLAASILNVRPICSECC